MIAMLHNSLDWSIHAEYLLALAHSFAKRRMFRLVPVVQVPTVLIAMLQPQVVHDQIELRVGVLRANSVERLLERFRLHLSGDVLTHRLEMDTLDHDRETDHHHELRYIILASDCFFERCLPASTASVVSNNCRIRMNN